MRNTDQVVLRTLGAILVTGGLVVACTTTNGSGGGETPGTDGGTTTEDGGVVPVDAAPPEPPKACEKDADCASGVCNQATKTCTAASCTDGVKNTTETDVDCGGACPKCADAKACQAATDCVSGVCSGNKCLAPTTSDGVKNGTETGVDCGGLGAPKCDNGQGCKARTDCQSDYCKNNVCTAVLPGDGEQNGNETDVDCGGDGNARCDDTLKCLVDADCKSDVCKDMADGNGLRCQAPSSTDGKKNGTETDVDCGGGGPGCAFGLSCVAGTDCASGGCNYQNKCAHARSCTTRYGGDTCGTGGAGGVGPENWEDCCTTIPVTTTVGGVESTVYLDKYPTTAGRMRVFLESINYDVRSFVQNARAADQIPVIPSKTNGTTKDGVNPVLAASWDQYLPTSFDGNADAGEVADCEQGTWDYQFKVCCATPSPTPANSTNCPANTTYSATDKKCHYWDGATCRAGATGIQNGLYTGIKKHLGGTIFRANSQTSTGCFVGSPGTHSLRFPDDNQDFGTPEQPQEVYDTKTLNCVDYLVGQAFCIWDGGRLESYGEWQAAYASSGSGLSVTPWTAAGDARLPFATGSATYWGCRFPWATDANQASCATKWDAATRTIELADWKYSYEYPKIGAQDYIVFLTAPGRTTGRGPLGHSDIIGAGFELTSSVDYNADAFTARHKWSGNGSWEVHDYGRTAGPSSMLLNKYGKLGLRCAKLTPN